VVVAQCGDQVEDTVRPRGLGEHAADRAFTSPVDARRAYATEYAIEFTSCWWKRP
jgi:hypothetical protein